MQVIMQMRNSFRSLLENVGDLWLTAESDLVIHWMQQLNEIQNMQKWLWQKSQVNFK